MKIILAFLLLTSSFTVLAGSYDDDLKQLFVITGVKNNYAGLNNVILNQLQAGFFQAADQNINGDSLTEEQKQQVGEMLKARFGEMVKSYQGFVAEKMSYEQIETEIYLPLYKEAYTHDEVKELLKFYNSDVGKKTVEITQKITEQAAKKSADKYDSIITEYLNQQIKENIDLVKTEMSEKGIN